MLSRLTSLFRALVRRDDFESGVAEEMRFHIGQYTDDLVRSGMAPAEAARRARIEFGNVHSLQLDCREARGVRVFDDTARNLRCAFRMLRRTPAFSAGVVATLALCVGSTLTIFAVVDSVLLRPLPFPDAGRLMSVYNTYPKAGVTNDGCSLTNYYERRGRIAAFAGVGAYREGAAIVGAPGATEREHVTYVSPDFFSTLGLGPVMGRAFTEEETAYRRSGVAILTDSYLETAPERRLGRDRTTHPCRRRGTDSRRRAAAGVQFPLVESQALPAARVGRRRTNGLPTALGQLRHGRAPQAGRVARRGAIADRCAQQRAGGDQPRRAGDGGRRVSFDRRAAARRPRRGGPRDPGAAAGGRPRAAVDRRGQRHQSVSDPRERPPQRGGGPPGDRRDPPAHRHGSSGGDDPRRRRGRGARFDGRGMGHRTAAQSGRRASAARRPHRVRCEARGRRPGRSGRRRRGDRGAHRLVSAQDPVVQRAAVGVPRNHIDARRSAPAPWLRRGSDRARLRPAGGRGTSGGEPPARHDGVSRIPAGQHPDQPDDAPGEELSGRRLARGIHRSPRDRAARSAGDRDVRLRHQCPSERRQQQERGHREGLQIPSRRNASRALLLQRRWRLLRRARLHAP